MQKQLVTENTKPTQTIQEQFNKDLRFACILSNMECSCGRFVFNGASIGSNPCGVKCAQVPNSAIIDKAKTKIEGKGELLFALKCFGTVASMNGAANMCEFYGDSVCYIETPDANETTNAQNGAGENETANGTETASNDDLPVITLIRDYQMSGGVEGREIYDEKGILLGTTKAGITLGKLTAKNDVFYTIEPHWVGNAKGISCIPEGEYLIKRHKSNKHGECIKVYNINGTGEVENRTEILIHKGNWVIETEGCIILGEKLKKNYDKTQGDFWVTPSEQYVKELRITIGDSGAILKITSGKSGTIKNTI